MKGLIFVVLVFLLMPHSVFSSEPAYDALPPELVKLQSEGTLTVRALWAWKLVPASTGAMALEFRALGHDLLNAKRDQLLLWLKQAEDGQLQLTAEQRTVLTALADRMNPGDAAPAVAEGIEPAAKMSADSPSSPAPSETRPNPADTGALFTELGAQAKDGNSKAMLAMALIAKTNAAGAPDPYQSIKLLEAAAKAGEADAMAMLADEYESGLWVARDVEKAGQLRRQAADAGSQLALWGME